MINLIISGFVAAGITLLFFLALAVIVAVGMVLGSIVNLGRSWIKRPRRRRELARIALEHHRARREIDAIADRAREQIREVGAAGQAVPIEPSGGEVERW
jgi:hypothetical protein